MVFKAPLFSAREQGALLNPETLQDFARRCRELMAGARTNVASEQLRVWAEEFEERAAILTREAGASEGPQKNCGELRSGSTAPVASAPGKVPAVMAGAPA
jgi:predicted RNA-binding Zn ribbon-like protein